MIIKHRKRILTISDLKTQENKNHNVHHLTAGRMATTQRTRVGTRRDLMRCCWQHQLVQLLWRAVCRLLKTTDNASWHSAATLPERIQNRIRRDVTCSRSLQCYSQELKGQKHMQHLLTIKKMGHAQTDLSICRFHTEGLTRLSVNVTQRGFRVNCKMCIGSLPCSTPFHTRTWTVRALSRPAKHPQGALCMLQCPRALLGERNPATGCNMATS